MFEYFLRNMHYLRPDEWGHGLKAGRRRLTKSSIFFEESEMDLCSLLAARMLTVALEMFRPTSVLDVGCGTGRALDWFLERGVDAIGIEGSVLARSKAIHPERIHTRNLNNPVDLSRRFDMVWSFEVAEHIHPKFVDNFLRTLTIHSNVIVLSAAPPGQGGEGHFNEQPPQYWIDKFYQLGFEYNQTAAEHFHQTGEFYCENMLVFVPGKK